MGKPIANPNPAQVFGRVSECMRRLFEEGLTYEDLQGPIDHPEMRKHLVEFWKNNAPRRIFLHPIEQFHEFERYYDWLKSVYPSYAILPNEMAEMEKKLASLPENALLFYCHGGDVVLTAQLAWGYISAYRQKTMKSEYIVFDPKRMKLHSREPKRPSGFYVLRRPEEDAEALGKRFQGKCVRDVREALRKDEYGAASEGIQFVGITHKHYLELMNGNEVPFIDLSGFSVAPSADDAFCYAPYLYFGGAELDLRRRAVGGPYSDCGSASFQLLSS